MGRPKTHSRKAKRLAKKKGIELAGENPGKFGVDEILQRAENFVEEYNYELAQKFIERALEIDCDHPKALEMAASLLLEAGQVEKAKQCFGRAITVNPDEGHSKYFAMAQLLTGQESLELYKRGIQVLNESISGLEADESAEAKRELSSAFCAMAELFMTDLCDEPEAEAECRGCIEKAVEVDGASAEAWQTKARLHLIKSEFQEARDSLDKSLSLWLPDYTAVLENRPEESAAKVDPVEVCPLSYMTRLSTARMLIELEQWDKAVQVLDGLTEEDDSVVDSWYLLGWLNHLRADQDEDDVYVGNARFYLQKAGKVNATNPSGDSQMIEHIEELLKELGPEPEEEQDDGTVEDVDDEWEDEDEDEMEQS